MTLTLTLKICNALDVLLWNILAKKNACGRRTGARRTHPLRAAKAAARKARSQNFQPYRAIQPLPDGASQ